MNQLESDYDRAIRKLSLFSGSMSTSPEKYQKMKNNGYFLTA